MSELKTRDGKLVSDIGSWEKEQLEKNPPKPYINPGSPKRKNTRGRKKQTVEENPMLYITRLQGKDTWVVNIKFVGFPSTNKSFKFQNYGGEEQALVAAKKVRDEYIEKYSDNGIK